MEWLPIETVPNLERVMVACWQPRQGSVAGYWWYHEDVTDENGVPMASPEATHFVLLSDICPKFPESPK